jgi:hypothetical protein
MDMNPGGKGEFRDGVMPNGLIQKMHYEDGRPKGIKIVLQEEVCGRKDCFASALNASNVNPPKTIAVQFAFSLYRMISKQPNRLSRIL